MYVLGGGGGHQRNYYKHILSVVPLNKQTLVVILVYIHVEEAVCLLVFFEVRYTSV